MSVSVFARRRVAWQHLAQRCFSSNSSWVCTRPRVREDSAVEAAFKTDSRDKAPVGVCKEEDSAKDGCLPPNGGLKAAKQGDFEQRNADYTQSMSTLDRIFKKFPAHPLNPSAKRVYDIYSESYRKQRTLASLSSTTSPHSSVLSSAAASSPKTNKLKSGPSAMGLPTKYELIARGVYHKSQPPLTGAWNQRQSNYEEMVDDIFWHISMNDFSGLSPTAERSADEQRAVDGRAIGSEVVADESADSRIKSVECMDFDAEHYMAARSPLEYDDVDDEISAAIDYSALGATQVLAVECKGDLKWKKYKMRKHKIRKRRKLVRLKAKNQKG